MSEDAILRQTYPLYDAFCREDEVVSDYSEADYEADRADDAWAEKGLEQYVKDR